MATKFDHFRFQRPRSLSNDRAGFPVLQNMESINFHLAVEVDNVCFPEDSGLCKMVTKTNSLGGDLHLQAMYVQKLAGLIKPLSKENLPSIDLVNLVVSSISQ